MISSMEQSGARHMFLVKKTLEIHLLYLVRIICFSSLYRRTDLVVNRFALTG